MGRYRIVDLELSEPLPDVVRGPDEIGYALIARWRDRIVGFRMFPAAPGPVPEATLLAQIGKYFTENLLAAKAEAQLAARAPASERPAPTLTVAICTRDRAERLERLLRSLHELPPSQFRQVTVLVVDNASSDDATRKAVEGFPAVRYVYEPKGGLDFARNAALQNAEGDLLAFLDDDVVVDRGWLNGLYKAWRNAPEAGGFTGLVLPYRLDTEAQIYFEERGGFGRGCVRNEFRLERMENRLHPLAAGNLGAGCNMAYRRALLVELGGFDEALDTGATLPGGGDLDIFYRVLRSGHPMVYEPSYAVYHEHRETIPQLKRQYWSWGLGFMAYLVKTKRTDPASRPQVGRMLRWWFGHQAMLLAKAAVKMRTRDFAFRAAELWGGVRGLAGEYDRSRKRVRSIAEAAS
ncbi:MAG TPA: glycosyltransferase [Caulobacteraceae bacterium]|nr:glycosyltransferase [Caulobacteraceae bacterium]